MSGEFIYRIQDKDGRGPWKPGFSSHWVEPRADHENLPTWMQEFGPVHLKLCTWEHCGSGCETIEQLQRWFTPGEYRKLLRLGYRAVKMEIGRFLGRSDIQCVFARSKPLNEDVEAIELYREKVA